MFFITTIIIFTNIYLIPLYCTYQLEYIINFLISIYFNVYFNRDQIIFNDTENNTENDPIKLNIFHYEELNCLSYDKHNCNFNWKLDKKEYLNQQNPQITSQKVEFI